MKVYAVCRMCSDNYYPDFTIEDNRLYKDKKEAKRQLDAKSKDDWWDFRLREFEVKE